MSSPSANVTSGSPAPLRHPLRHSPLYPSDEFEIEAQYNYDVIQTQLCDKLATPTSPAFVPSSSFVLEGKHVRLTPFDMQKHGASLFHHLGPDEDGVAWGTNSSSSGRSMNWLVQTKGPYRTREQFDASFKPLVNVPIDDQNSPLHIFFRHQFYAFEVVKSKKRQYNDGGDDDEYPIVGTGALFRCDPKNRVIEIGHLAFCPAHLQGTTASTESFFLLFRHCFRDLGYRRVEWKTNSQNTKSRQAALRLGFNFEGVFRQLLMYDRENQQDHQLGDDTRNRDTAWYGMYDKDWFAFLENGYLNYLRQFDNTDDGADDDNQGVEGKKKLMECLIEEQKKICEQQKK